MTYLDDYNSAQQHISSDLGKRIYRALLTAAWANAESIVVEEANYAAAIVVNPSGETIVVHRIAVTLGMDDSTAEAVVLTQITSNFNRLAILHSKRV